MILRPCLLQLGDILYVATAVPTLAVTNDGDGATVTATITDADAGDTVQLLYRLTSDSAWTVGDTRSGNGIISQSGLSGPAEHEFIAYAVALGIPSTPSVPVILSVYAPPRSTGWARRIDTKRRPTGRFEDVRGLSNEDALASLSEMVKGLYARTDYVEVTGHTKAGSFELSHGLGHKPSGFTVVSRPDRVHVSNDSSRSHDATKLRLSASAEGRQITLRVW